MAVCHLRLAAIVQQHGPQIALRHHFGYPVELESAVMGYVAGELDLLDLSACIAKAGIAT